MYARRAISGAFRRRRLPIIAAATHYYAAIDAADFCLMQRGRAA
jgi:hypothetical protein